VYFFLNEDRKKYVYVAFYSAQGYTAHVEFGTAKAAILKLTQQQFTMLNEHLPGLIGALCADDYYNTGVYDSSWITTGGSYKTIWIFLGLGKRNKQFVFKLPEPQYLNSIMNIVSYQLARVEL
jgi:hypothetical protein